MFDVNNLIKYTKELKLLYVEDDEFSREATLLILEDLFDEIIIAVDGKDGLDKFKTNDIDIIITDIEMPNMDGLEMSKLIKEIDSSQSIIIFTAITNIEIIKEAIDIDIDYFINKPISDIDILFNKLDKIVKKIQYDKEQKELVLINQEKEKIQLICNMIKNIAHHWKQPLSVITTLSSVCSFKLENNLEITTKDFEGADLITQKAKELSKILEEIENLDFDVVSIKDIERLVKISNPIYENN